MVHLKSCSEIFYHGVWFKVLCILTKTYPISNRVSGKWKLLFLKDIIPRQLDASICLVHTHCLIGIVAGIPHLRVCWKRLGSSLCNRKSLNTFYPIITWSFFKSYMENPIPKTVWRKNDSKFTNPAKPCGEEETSRQESVIFSGSFARPHCFVWLRSGT